MKPAAGGLAVFACALLAFPVGAEPPAWRVVSPTGGELRLLGSIHYLRQSDYPLPASIDRLYSSADVLVMELDLDDLDPMQMSQALLARGAATDGQSLAQRLPPDTLRNATDAAQDLGLPLEALSPFEPWLVALTLIQLKMSQLGYDPSVGLEQHLLARARGDDKEIVGLETLDDQLAVFDELSNAQQAEFLQQTIDEMAQVANEAAMLVDAWAAGNVEMLATDLLAGLSEFPALYRKLVVARNMSWADRLVALSRSDQSYLVVVGTLHLVGADSLIGLLEKRGFKVERL